MNRLITLTGMLVLVLLALLPGCTGAPSTTTVSHTVTTTQDNPVTTTVTETAIPATVTNTHTVTATSTVTTIPPTVTVTVTRTITTPPPTTTAAIYDIVEPISYHVPDKTVADWKFIWQTTIKNLTNSALSLFLTVEFWDITDILVDRTVRTANFAPLETLAIEGDVEMIAEIANTVRSVTMNIRVLD